MRSVGAATAVESGYSARHSRAPTSCVPVSTRPRRIYTRRAIRTRSLATTRSPSRSSTKKIFRLSRRRLIQQPFQAVPLLVGPTLRRFVELGLLDDAGGRIRLTRHGLLINNALWPDLLQALENPTM